MGDPVSADNWREHFGLFDTQEPPTARVNGHQTNSAYEAISLSLNWKNAEGVYSPPGHFLVASLTPIPLLQCCYERTSSPAYRFAGDVMWLPPGADLKCRWGEGEQNTIACVFDFERLGEMSGIEWIWNEAEAIAGLDIRNPYIRMALRRVAEEVESPSFASDLQLDCTIMFLFLELHRHFQTLGKDIGTEKGKLSASQMRKLSDMIEDNFTGAATLKSLAQAVGVGPRQLSEQFQNSTGVTLRSYVAQARIRHAQTLLLDEKILSKQVAYRSGFQDAASFAAAFRRSTGLSPSEFRRRHVTEMRGGHALHN
ncbi:MAG: Transcriptional regulator, AraC family [Sphingomonadales bacterium]|nr:Transcriptional regulator, AraC family [Sphingomonadales bacterium]